MKLLFALSLLVLGAGCRPSCEPRTQVQVPTMPPAPLDEPPSNPAHAPGLSWVAGYWHWDSLRWVWIPGHWVSTPTGQRWYPARYGANAEGHFTYRPGAFSCVGDDDE